MLWYCNTITDFHIKNQRLEYLLETVSKQRSNSCLKNLTIFILPIAHILEMLKILLQLKINFLSIDAHMIP